MSQTLTNRLPLSRQANLLLSVPGSRLFRPHREYHEIECLPFVQDHQEEDNGHECWSFQRPESSAMQTEQGKAFAAAYFLFISRNGDGAFPLAWIVDSMRKADSGEDGDAVAQGFFFYLTQLLQDFGTYVSALDVEQHLASVIADDRTYYEPQDLAEVGA